MSNFFEQVRDIFIYMKEPLLVGILLSLCAAILGVVLVLKRHSMIGDGLSHVAFGSVAVALALGQTPIQFALPIVMVAAYILLRLGQNTKIKADAAIAILSSSALAIGYLAGSLERFHRRHQQLYVRQYHHCFKTDLYLILPLSAIIIICFILFYNRIFAVTFDESFAKATGMPVLQYPLAIFTAIVVVIGMRIMGTC